MIGPRIVIGTRAKDDGEKPFWISFADLMSALMVLFLVVMSVALLAVTKTVTEAEEKDAVRSKEIAGLLRCVDDATQRHPGIKVVKERNAIDFGDRARFNSGSSQLAPEQAITLRSFVPEVLRIARGECGKGWLKRILVEGFTDKTGDYLLNLNLSLQRSQRVLCVLFSPPLAGEPPLVADELEQIRRLFLVGGYSSNSAKPSLDESRRIELKLEFYTVNERPVASAIGSGSSDEAITGSYGSCRI